MDFGSPRLRQNAVFSDTVSRSQPEAKLVHSNPLGQLLSNSSVTVSGAGLVPMRVSP
jgi:hypothetical protein